jgi:hypothetical protein
MKKLSELKKLDKTISNGFNDLYSILQDEIKEIKKEHNNILIEEKIKLLMLICNGEGLKLDDIKKKYLADKEIDLLDKNKIEILNTSEDDTLLDKIKIEDKNYYLSKSNIVYNSNNEVIGVFKDGKIIS